MSPPTLPKRSPSSTTTSTTANASSTPTNSINAFASTKDGSLSIGAKAGIALAALIITALILVGILFIMRRKKQARKASMGGAAGQSGTPLARGRGSNGSSLEGEDGLEKRGVRDAVQVVRT